MCLVHSQNGKTKRTHRANEKYQTRSRKDIAQSHQQRNDTSKSKTCCSEQRRGRSRIGSLTIHGQSRRSCKSQSHRKKQHKQHSLIYSKMIFITKDYKLYRNFKLPARKSSPSKMKTISNIFLTIRTISKTFFTFKAILS